MHRKEALRQMRREQDWKEASEELQAIFANYRLEQSQNLIKAIQVPEIVVHQPSPKNDYGHNGAHFQIWQTPGGAKPEDHQQNHANPGLNGKI
jgi:hypothetical protein